MGSHDAPPMLAGEKDALLRPGGQPLVDAGRDLLAITSLTDSSGNTLVEGTDVLAYPLSGPPYSRIEIKLDSGDSLNYSGTTQRRSR
jgi:hypothetical protein